MRDSLLSPLLTRITYRRHREVTGIPPLLAPGVGTDVVVPGHRHSEGAAGGRRGAAGCHGGRSRGRVVVQGDDTVTELLKVEQLICKNKTVMTGWR